MAFDLKSSAAPRAAEVRGRSRSRQGGRWGAGVAASVLLHVAPLIVAGGLWASRPSVVLPPEPVFEVELVRLQAPPRPPSEQPPGPTQVEAAAQQPVPKLPIQPRLQVAAVADVEPLSAPPPTPRQEAAAETPPRPKPRPRRAVRRRPPPRPRRRPRPGRAGFWPIWNGASGIQPKLARGVFRAWPMSASPWTARAGCCPPPWSTAQATPPLTARPWPSSSAPSRYPRRPPRRPANASP